MPQHTVIIGNTKNGINTFYNYLCSFFFKYPILNRALNIKFSAPNLNLLFEFYFPYKLMNAYLQIYKT